MVLHVRSVTRGIGVGEKREDCEVEDDALADWKGVVSEVLDVWNFFNYPLAFVQGANALSSSRAYLLAPVGQFLSTLYLLLYRLSSYQSSRHARV